MMCLERRDLSHNDRMPAHEWEIVEAEEEGVNIHDRLGPTGVIVEDGKVKGLATRSCTSVYDAKGAFKATRSPKAASMAARCSGFTTCAPS